MTDWLSRQEAETFFETHPDIAGIDMMVPDMCGILRGKRIGHEARAKLYDNGIMLPGSTYMLDATGQNCATLEYGSKDGDPDNHCFGVAETLVPVPWARTPTAQVLASMRNLDGTPYFADPRHILREAAKPLYEMGLKPVSALELEFYLVDGTVDGDHRPQPALAPGTGLPQTTTQVYGMEELYDFEAFLNDVEKACRIQGVPADTATAEYGPGQFEINLHHTDDPVRACDHAIMLKRLIKGVARRHGLMATFMAKPFPDISGCGMHIHCSLVDKDGTNIFGADAVNPETGLPNSEHLKHAIGGLIETAGEGMALFAPNANSYRRFQADSYAPINTAWGVDNRTVSLRIPRGDASAMRVEHRMAGADANPYLVMAAVLAGIHHGLANKSDPGPIETGNAYEKPAADLPLRWWQAINRFADGTILPDYLGAHYCDIYAKARTFESDNFQAHISQLDYQWYLRTV